MTEFIHLTNKTEYSLSEGALPIARIAELCQDFKMPAVGITDSNNMFGALEFSTEISKAGIQPIIGSSINLLDIQANNNFSQINLLVKNIEGYKNLLYLSSISHTKQNNIVGIRIEDLRNHTNGLICFIGGQLNPLLMLKLQNKTKKIYDFINTFLDIFSDNFYFEIQRINNSLLSDYEGYIIELSQKYKIPIISSNNVKFEKASDHNAHDVLLCISQKATISQDRRIFSNPNTYFKSS